MKMVVLLDHKKKKDSESYKDFYTNFSPGFFLFFFIFLFPRSTYVSLCLSMFLLVENNWRYFPQILKQSAFLYTCFLFYFF